MIAPARRSKPLRSILTALPHAEVHGDLETAVHAVSHDSRTVTRGALFVALAGERADGHAFVRAALENGAAAAVVSRSHFAEVRALASGHALVAVDDPHNALAAVAATFYDHPSLALRVAGVTGTNGKTTTTFLIQAILQAASVRTGRIGTLGAAFEREHAPLPNTTPLADDLQATLAAMLERGAAAVAMEVSSHALAQGRVAGTSFETAAFTNLTRDHLDFHGTLGAYAAAKRKLFDGAHTSVLNADDSYGRAWTGELRAQGQHVVTYALDAEADLRATGVVSNAHATTFTLDGTRFELGLRGRFNIANALAAVGVARSFGVRDACSAQALAAFERVPGRMETLSAGGVTVVVDYAHTPDALASVLQSARQLARSQVAAVFGCGGDRDAGKRPQMGAIAEAAADRVTITNDNPRSEDPGTIAAAILRGMNRPSGASVQLDRRAAIREAILRAQDGDVVVIAGKGHEPYQIVGERMMPFDDRDEARAALAARESAAVG